MKPEVVQLMVSMRTSARNVNDSFCAFVITAFTGRSGDPVRRIAGKGVKTANVNWNHFNANYIVRLCSAVCRPASPLDSLKSAIRTYIDIGVAAGISGQAYAVRYT